MVTALLDGDEVTGVTIILTDEGMDTGPVVAQQREPVLPEDTATVLTERLFHLGAELLVESLPAWEADRIAPVPQDESRASTTRLYTKADGEMDWALSARALERRLKAFDAWPGCHTRWRGRGLRVLEGVVVRGETVGHVPGDVIPMLGMADPPVAVVTGEGALGVGPASAGWAASAEVLRSFCGATATLLAPGCRPGGREDSWQADIGLL